MKFIEIKLIPTMWACDWWIYKDRFKLAEMLNKRYGKKIEYYENTIGSDECYKVKSEKNSELKGQQRIVVTISDKSDECIIHEANHVVYELFRMLDIDDPYENQEWHSYYLEYIFKTVKEGIKNNTIV